LKRNVKPQAAHESLFDKDSTACDGEDEELKIKNLELFIFFLFVFLSFFINLSSFMTAFHIIQETHGLLWSSCGI
jgi:hypothetical protein